MSKQYRASAIIAEKGKGSVSLEVNVSAKNKKSAAKKAAELLERICYDSVEAKKGVVSWDEGRIGAEGSLKLEKVENKGRGSEILPDGSRVIFNDKEWTVRPPEKEAEEEEEKEDLEALEEDGDYEEDFDEEEEMEL